MLVYYSSWRDGQALALARRPSTRNRKRQRKVVRMLHSLKLSRSLIAAAAIVWGVALGTPANANQILITPRGRRYENPATVTSTQAGNVFVGLVDGQGAAFAAGTGSFTDATGFALVGVLAQRLRPHC